MDIKNITSDKTLILELRYFENNSKQYYYTYLLLCNNDKFYCGITNNIQRRLKEHSSGYSIFTRRYKKVELLMAVVFKSRKESRIMEKDIKEYGVAKYYKAMKIDILNYRHKEKNIIYFKNVMIPE